MRLQEFCKQYGLVTRFFTTHRDRKVTGRQMIALDDHCATLAVNFREGFPVTGKETSATYRASDGSLTNIFCNARGHVVGLEKTIPQAGMTRIVVDEGNVWHTCPDDQTRHRTLDTGNEIFPGIRDLIDTIRMMVPTLHAVCKALVGYNNNDCEEIDDFFARHAAECTTGTIEFIFDNENALTVSFKDGNPDGDYLGPGMPVAVYDDKTRNIHYALVLGPNGLVERCEIHTRNGTLIVDPKEILSQAHVVDVPPPSL